MSEGAMCCVPARHRKKMWVRVLMDNLLIILIVIAVGAGVGMGIGLREVWTHEDVRKIWYLGFPGRLLLNMLKMLILPLVVSSLITGMASISNSASGKLGGAAVLYYMVTTLLAVIVGIILVMSIGPGENTGKLRRAGKSTKAEPLDSLLDLISQCFPDNLVTASFQRRVTEIETKTFLYDNDTRSVTVDSPYLVSKSGTNVLGIVVFSIALGCVINNLGPQGEPLKAFFDSLNSATMVLVKIVIWYTPIGILFLIAGKFVETEDIGKVLSDLGLYMATVLAGLAIHGFVVLPLLFLVATRKNPFKFALNMSKALFTAWGTASSSATLPITMDCLVNKNEVNINVVRFVAPVGATINMDGTALYEAVACIFIAQVNNYDLSAADIIIISLTATAAAIGAAGVPQAGLVTMVIVLTAVGLPTEDVTLILAIDWFLDRFRTAINVWGDSVGAGILNHVFRRLFREQEQNAIELMVDSPDFNSNNSVSKTNEKEEDDDRPPSYNGVTNQAFEDTPNTYL
ncbi:excitatory amino acid transporter 1-like [Aplysia californica]|uniref:Amino acid transporter n=1 Tax=Aplysia californica TaxID=6500 RepID=A0ABM1W1Z3_APLCA|nr:excitatory amino acid transporter 1-like [Aplysia californica]